MKQLLPKKRRLLWNNNQDLGKESDWCNILMTHFRSVDHMEGNDSADRDMSMLNMF